MLPQVPRPEDRVVDEGALLALGSNRLAAIASDADGLIERVEFFANGASLGLGRASATNGNLFTLDWFASQPGWFALTARATDNGGAIATSNAISIRVNAPNQPPVHPIRQSG